ncbi:Integrin beta-7 [Merluccius polli]|uniref:Integrin beta n=1 Tax=Merluccius polli TaxID=89951 RepID=A0AA47P8L3_MERPO|nr:Integrin beta-7 [Merluccius polli]
MCTQAQAAESASTVLGVHGVQRQNDSTVSPGMDCIGSQDFLRAEEPRERRCAAEEELTIRHCDKLHQIHRNTDPDVLKNNELSNSTDNEVQLKPQNIHIPLIEFHKRSRYRSNGLRVTRSTSITSWTCPSPWGIDLDTIKTLSLDIVNTLHKFTSNMRIGFGSFVDKVVLPYVSQIPGKKNNPCPYRGFNCQPAFSYRNILSLTKDAADFKKEVSRQRISGCDWVEERDEDPGPTRRTTRSTSLGTAGWLVSMSLTTADAISTEDYPSIGHLARVLKANNIKLVFAVTENIAEAYKRLSQMIPQSVVGVLKSDSSNVVQLITNAYNSLSSTILLEHHDAPQGLALTASPAKAPVPWRSSGECKDIKLNQQVDFTVQLTISECLKEATEFHLSVQGISEKLRVSVADAERVRLRPGSAVIPLLQR